MYAGVFRLLAFLFGLGVFQTQLGYPQSDKSLQRQASMIGSLIFLATVATSSANYRAQHPLPTTTVPDGWGVNIHFTNPAPGEMELLAAAGFKWVRMDLFWHQIETKKGVYDFSAYDRLMAALQKHKIRPIFILDYGNDLYQSGSPREPHSIEGFCNYVKAAVERYRGQGVVWEMWNEPNIFFWQPKPDVKQYIALALAVGKTIRKVAPEEWYVGPATSGFDFGFLNACFDAGLLKYWDAVTVHPYRTSAPETVVGDWTKLRELVRKYEPKREVPLISGEWGYSELYSGLNLEKQAQYIARQYLVNLSCGVGLSIWYDWKNDGTDPKEIEHHFGTVYHDLKPKPTYHSAKTLVESLRGYKFAMRLRQPDPSDWILLFKDARGRGKAVGWTTSPESQSRLYLDGTPRLLGPRQLPSAFIVRASRFVKLPESAIVDTPKDAERLLRPLLESLREGESLTVYDTAPEQAIGSVKGLRLTKGDLPRLGSVTGKLERLTDILNPVRTLTVALSSPGIPDIVQASDVTRPTILFQIIGTEGDDLVMQVENQRDAFTCSLRPTASSKLFPIELRKGTQQVRLKGYFKQIAELDVCMTLLDSKNRPVGRIFEAKKLNSVPVNAGTWSAVVEGDAKIKGEASVRVVDKPSRSQEALAIDYALDQGWKYVIVRNSEQLRTPSPGRPVSLTMKIKGDGSGAALKVRIVDSTGQTHQVDGVDMDWTDSRHLTFDLTKTAVSWGGRNDSKVHLPVRFDALLLIDSKGKESKGTVEISDLVVTYEDRATR